MFKTNLNSILSSLEGLVEKLGHHAEACEARAEESAQKALLHDAESRQHYEEAVRANRVALKVKELLR